MSAKEQSVEAKVPAGPNMTGKDKMDAKTFASTMGEAVWLMTMSAEHKELPISTIEHLVSPAILFRRFRLLSQKNKPVAFLVWANVTDEIKARIESGNKTLEPTDWNSGENIVVVDCIAPFGGKDEVVAEFLKGIGTATAKVRNN